MPSSGTGIYRASASGLSLGPEEIRGPEPGPRRPATLGRHGEMSAEQARRSAAEAIDRIKRGRDPLPPAPESEPTMAVVAERYMREHVTDLHYAMRGAPHAANMALRIVGRMLSLAVEWSLRETGPNPCRAVRPYRTRPRERFLTDAEYRRLGRALDRLETRGRVSRHAAAAIRLLVLTGCRRNEVLELRWDDVDRAAGDCRQFVACSVSGSNRAVRRSAMRRSELEAKRSSSGCAEPNSMLRPAPVRTHSSARGTPVPQSSSTPGFMRRSGSSTARSRRWMSACAGVRRDRNG